MKKFFKNNKFVIFTSVFLIVLCIGFVKQTFQNDTFYTIKIGKLILKNGIDMKDHFSYHNLAYTYPHWLYDVFIYLTYLAGGFKGVYISTIVLYIILILTIYYVNNKLNKNVVVAFFVALISLIGLAGYATARAQLVSYILFILEFYFIECFLKTSNKKYIFYLLLISLLLCNIHVAVWPFYYIIFLPFIGEYIISLIVNKFNLKDKNKFTKLIFNKFVVEDNKNYKYLFLIIFLSLFTGLITPIKDTPYTYIIKTMMGNSQGYISEHKAVKLINSPFIYILLLEMAVLILLSKIKLRNLFLLAGLVVMALSSMRHLSFLVLFGLFVFGSVLTYIVDNYDLDYVYKIKKFMEKWYMFIILLILSFGASYLVFESHSKGNFVDKKMYPVEMTKYIKKNLDLDKVTLYNDYNFGSYLLLNDVKVFIDSRADLYMKEFSGLDHDMFDDYMTIYRKGYYEIYFDRYNITHALIYKDQILYSNLKNSKNYILLKEDDNFALFKRVVEDE